MIFRYPHRQDVSAVDSRRALGNGHSKEMTIWRLLVKSCPAWAASVRPEEGARSETVRSGKDATRRGVARPGGRGEAEPHRAAPPKGPHPAAERADARDVPHDRREPAGHGGTAGRSGSAPPEEWGPDAARRDPCHRVRAGGVHVRHLQHKRGIWRSRGVVLSRSGTADGGIVVKQLTPIVT